MPLSLAGLPVRPQGRRLSRKADRNRLVRHIKQLRRADHGTLGFEKAEVTAGGVALDEVDSRTMQSKLVPDLFLAGEVLDLDGPIGGYNFQAAWSTGWLAGSRYEDVIAAYNPAPLSEAISLVIFPPLPFNK